ncbi:MAG: hypothetical protein ACOCRX_09850 [Candidatus Woesearchaeota archaeon]
MKVETINLYYLLEKKNLTPKLKQLKLEFDEAIADWNKAHNDLDSAEEIKDIDNAIDKMHKANEKISNIRLKIEKEKATHK